MQADFAALSYQLHQSHEDTLSNESPSVFTHPDSIDTWRHSRMHDLASSLHLLFKNDTWLTIGDSGADAHYLKSRGIEKVISSCISIKRLLSLKEKEFLKGVDIREINAEEIDFKDDSVDVVFCKEAYHHLPRPPIGFYEFLRVAKKAVVLIEPAEKIRWGILDILKDMIKSKIRSRPKSFHLFEPSGNFLFRASESEFVKMATSLQLDTVAVKYSNDFYLKSIAKKDASDSVAMSIEKFGLMVQNFLCHLGLMNFGLITFAIFKAPLEEKDITVLESSGFKIIDIPKNPYLSHADSP